MSISHKVFMILMLLVCIFLTTNFYIQKEVIFPAFSDIENQNARESIDRIDALLHNSVNQVDRINYDWSAWNDTYEFMQDRNERYRRSNLGSDTFTNLQLNLAYFLDSRGEVFWGNAFGIEGTYTKSSEVQQVITTSIKKLNGFFAASHSGLDSDSQFVRGIYVQNNTPIIFSIRPILDSDGSGPSRGYSVMGRAINSRLIGYYQNQVKTEFTVDIVNPEDIEEVLLDSDHYNIRQTSGDSLEVFKYFYLDNVPVLKLGTIFPRDITRSGLQSINYALVTLLIVGLLSIVILWVLLKFSILNPIRELTRQMQSIAKSHDYSLHSTIKGKDEIGTLAGEFNKMLSIVHDNNIELQAVNKKLELQATTDPLTGLANRLSFENKLEVEWNTLRRSRQSLAILMIDIDYFKPYNDHYGHQSGDSCLKKVAAILLEAMQRSNDMAARFGGEEFILIMPGHNITSATVMAEKVLNALSDNAIPHSKSKISDKVSVSIGIAAVAPDESSSIKILIRNADSALYRAKENGRNRYEIARQEYSPDQ